MSRVVEWACQPSAHTFAARLVMPSGRWNASRPVLYPWADYGVLDKNVNQWDRSPNLRSSAWLGKPKAGVRECSNGRPGL